MNISPEKSQQTSQPIRPPQLIQSLVGGFNTVAGNISLILLPVALDLLLWFGPHLRLRALMGPEVRELLAWMRERGAVESRPAVDALQTQMAQFLEHYNLFSTLSTFPVGLPSRISGLAPLDTPMGSAPVFEVNNYAQFIIGWLALLALGFILGSLYFALVARSCCPRGIIPAGKDTAGAEAAQAAQSASPCPEDFPFGRAGLAVRPASLIWQTLQVVWMVLLLLAGLVILMVPVLIVTLLVALFSTILAQFVLLVLAFTTIWFLTPLVFTPHGIFLCGYGVFRAMLNSTRVVRLSLPGTAMFLLTLLVLQQGLGVLWATPAETSWMTLVGIFGHAFISTGLLAAMFFYYRGGMNYIQFLRREAAASTAGNSGSASGSSQN